MFISGKCDNADTSIPSGPKRAVGPDDDPVVRDSPVGHRHLHLRDGDEEGKGEGACIERRSISLGQSNSGKLQAVLGGV